MANKLNLHVHSIGSFDTTITLEELAHAFDSGLLDQVAITDHNEIKLAQEALKRFGEKRIIVGQEITTAEKKHLIGLFLNKFVPRGLPVARTAELIRSQGGLVYTPHPYEPSKGIGHDNLELLEKENLVDIVEGFNSWNYRNIISRAARKTQNEQAEKFALERGLPHASASDAHTQNNLGNAYVEVAEVADRQNLVEMLRQEDLKHKREYNRISGQFIRAGIRALNAKIREGKWA